MGCFVHLDLGSHIVFSTRIDFVAVDQQTREAFERGENQAVIIETIRPQLRAQAEWLLDRLVAGHC